jgi:hypothetical protein
MAERTLDEWTDAELLDAAAHVNREKYPDEAAALDCELARRRIAAPLFEQHCGLRIGWTYYDHPLGRIALYPDRVVVTSLSGNKATVPFASLTGLAYQRDPMAKFLQLEHTAVDTPEVAVWTPDLEKLAGRIAAMTGLSLPGK